MMVSRVDLSLFYSLLFVLLNLFSLFTLLFFIRVFSKRDGGFGFFKSDKKIIEKIQKENDLRKLINYYENYSGNKVDVRNYKLITSVTCLKCDYFMTEERNVYAGYGEFETGIVEYIPFCLKPPSEDAAKWAPYLNKNFKTRLNSKNVGCSRKKYRSDKVVEALEKRINEILKEMEEKDLQQLQQK